MNSNNFLAAVIETVLSSLAAEPVLYVNKLEDSVY